MLPEIELGHEEAKAVKRLLELWEQVKDTDEGHLAGSGVEISWDEADVTITVATHDLLLSNSLIEKVLEGDKQLREGASLLTHEEVFSK